MDMTTKFAKTNCPHFFSPRSGVSLGADRPFRAGPFSAYKICKNELPYSGSQ
jgi:hypothetical protein